MEEKVMLVDVSKCTACRACQVACKQWNKLPALKTQQEGTHQNPPDLNWATWNLIRFTELPDEGWGDEVALPQGCLPALHGPRLPAGLPGSRLYYQDSRRGRGH